MTIQTILLVMSLKGNFQSSNSKIIAAIRVTINEAKNEINVKSIESRNFVARSPDIIAADHSKAPMKANPSPIPLFQISSGGKNDLKKKEFNYFLDTYIYT